MFNSAKQEIYPAKNNELLTAWDFIIYLQETFHAQLSCLDKYLNSLYFNVHLCHRKLMFPYEV